MSDDDSRAADEVGYRRPPIHSRFQKGRSGNPRGRQKGVRNFSSDLMASLELPVSLNENGKSRRVSTQMALILRTREKALKGDHRALENLITLARAYNYSEPKHNNDQQSRVALNLTGFTEEELDVLERLLRKACGVEPNVASEPVEQSICVRRYANAKVLRLRTR